MHQDVDSSVTCLHVNKHRFEPIDMFAGGWNRTYPARRNQTRCLLSYPSYMGSTTCKQSEKIFAQRYNIVPLLKLKPERPIDLSPSTLPLSHIIICSLRTKLGTLRAELGTFRTELGTLRTAICMTRPQGSRSTQLIMKSGVRALRG